MQDNSENTANRPFLLDVSRLIWRVWTGRLPTGIDRVCLAYMDHFGDRSQAVVQREQFRIILSPGQSDRLFALLREGGKSFRLRLVLLLVAAVLFRRSRKVAGKFYLNIGHTGLDAHGLVDWVRRKRVRPIYLIHDLIPITHPEFCRANEDRRHRTRMHHALESASGIITNSQETLDALDEFAIVERMTLPESLVAWLGTEELEPAGKRQHQGRPYFLTIGTIEARKNHLMLLHIWERLAQRMGDDTPRLLLVGQRGWEADDAFAMLDRSPKLRRHVRELGRCDDPTMLALIDGARALLMPSFVEGFGIPVIEALQRGTPVIASDLPVFREITGDIPFYLDPLDGQSWEAAIREFCQDCPERERQLAAMPRFHAPSWSDHFRKVEHWLAGMQQRAE